jgi:hypothetical protein
VCLLSVLLFGAESVQCHFNEGYNTKVVGRDLIFLLTLVSFNSDQWLGRNCDISATESGFSVYDKLLFA